MQTHFCSNMAKSGMNPKTLQYIMGHSDISVTLNVYTHVQFDDAQAELLRVAKPKTPRWYRAFIYQRIYQYCREKHEKIREDLRRYPGNTETGKCRKNLQYWAFEKKYKAKTEL